MIFEKKKRRRRDFGREGKNKDEDFIKRSGRKFEEE